MKDHPDTISERNKHDLNEHREMGQEKSWFKRNCRSGIGIPVAPGIGHRKSNMINIKARWR